MLRQFVVNKFFLNFFKNLDILRQFLQIYQFSQNLTILHKLKEKILQLLKE